MKNLRPFNPVLSGELTQTSAVSSLSLIFARSWGGTFAGDRHRTDDSGAHQPRPIRPGGGGGARRHRPQRGLAGGTISATSKQPLAMNETLLTISRAHDQDMLAHNYFDHTDSSGHNPVQRMTAAGYAWTTWGENIAWSGSTGTVTTQMTLDMEKSLFVDSGVSGRGHRTNLLERLLSGGRRRSRERPLPGLQRDADHAGFREPTGRGAIADRRVLCRFRPRQFLLARRGPRRRRRRCVGRQHDIDGERRRLRAGDRAGQQTVTFSGGGLASPVKALVTVLAGVNAKVDMVDQGALVTSASLTALSGVSRIIGLGTLGLTLTGDAAAQTFSGGKGDDTINGGGGVEFRAVRRRALRLRDHESRRRQLQGLGPRGNGHADRDRAPRLHRPDNLSRAHADARFQRRRAVGHAVEQFQRRAGGGSPTAPAASPTRTSARWRRVGRSRAGDFNADGHADLLWSDANGDRYLWNSKASGGFAYVDLGVISTAWTASEVGDFNGDGKADMLWSNTNGDRYLWTGDGAGGFSATDLGVIANGWSVSGVGDFNGDGKSDVRLEQHERRPLPLDLQRGWRLLRAGPRRDRNGLDHFRRRRLQWRRQG